MSAPAGPGRTVSEWGLTIPASCRLHGASLTMMNLNRILLFLCTVGTAVLLAGCSTTCGGRAPVRAIDQAHLPAPRNYSDLPLYRRDIDTEYVEIASIDSVVMPRNDTDSVKCMLEDLKAKACAAGADAVVKVQLLEQKKRGFVNNPRTPFPSWKQGEWQEYFFRGTGIKYVCRPKGEPGEKSVGMGPKRKTRDKRTSILP